MITTAKLILIRHGECLGGHIIRGRTDSQLSALGCLQLQSSTDKLLEGYGKPSAISCSPLLRCQQFAADKAKELAVSLTIEPQLAEINYGDWDGLTFEHVYENSPQAIDGFFNDPWSNPPPQGETMTQFERRVNSGFDKLCLLVSSLVNNADIDIHHNEEPCLWVFTHGGVIRQIMAHILGIKQQPFMFTNIDIPYGAVIPVSLCWDNGQCFSRLVLGEISRGPTDVITVG